MYCTGTKRVAMSIQYEYAFQPLDALESMRRMNGIVCNPDSRCYLVLICLTIPHASEPCSKFNDPPIYIYECTHSMSTVRSINPPFAFFCSSLFVHKLVHYSVLFSIYVTPFKHITFHIAGSSQEDNL